MDAESEDEFDSDEDDSFHGGNASNSDAESIVMHFPDSASTQTSVVPELRRCVFAILYFLFYNSKKKITKY